MGCGQVRVKAAPNTTEGASSTPSYVKSALKGSKSHREWKAKKRSILHRKNLAPNKSVNFDERVRIKSRTPTPKARLYEKQSSSRGSIPKDEDVTSISSDEDSSIDQTSESSSTSSRQKTTPRNAVSPAPATSYQSVQSSLTHPRLIEHHLPLANGGSSPQTTYYEFSRRQGDQLKPSYTKRTTN